MPPLALLRELSDSALIRRFLDGDEGAFRALHDRHTPRIRMTIARLLGARRDEVDDVLQDTWLAGCRGMHTFNGSAQFSSWLTTIGIRAAYARFPAPHNGDGESLDAVPAPPAPAAATAIDLDRALARLRLRDWSRPPLDQRLQMTLDSRRIRLSVNGDSSARLSALVTVLDSLRNRLSVPLEATENTSRFGFALACDPSCTKTRARDGSEYWKFDGYPRVAALRPGGPAEWAGMKIGDRVTDVEDVSILTERGALNFLHSETRSAILVTVLRDGKKEKLMMAAIVK